MGSGTRGNVIVIGTRRGTRARQRTLERAAERHLLTVVRRGAYADPDEFADASEVTRHRAFAHAVQYAARRQLVFSHATAAVLLGLPLVGTDLRDVHVRTGAASGHRSRNGIVRHSGAFPASEVMVGGGLLVTSPELTAMDIAATADPRAGLIVIEHVLHAENAFEVELDDLRRLHEERGSYRGCRRVADLLDLASSRSASPLESLSRWQIRRFGFVQPQQQRDYAGLSGAAYTVDFWWPSVDVIGEADGWGKYEERARERGITVEQVLREEKRREDELRAQSHGFVRWEWSDAWAGDPLAAKLRRAGIPRVR